LVMDVVWKIFGEPLQHLADLDVYFAGVGSAGLQDVEGQPRMAVYLVVAAQVGGTEFGAGNIFEVKHRAVGIGFDDDLLELLGQGEPTLVAEDGFEGFVRRFAEFAGRNLKVLVADCVADVLRHQAIGSHFFGVEPGADGVIARADPAHLAHAIHARELPHEVDLRIGLQERLIVKGVRMVAVDIDGHDDAALARFYRDARLDDLGRDARIGLRYPRLHVYGGLVGVCPRFEKHGDVARTGVRGRRQEIGHVRYAIDGFFDGKQYGTGYGFGVGAGVGGRYRHTRRSDFREPGDRELPHRYQPEDDKERGNYGGQNWPVDECFEHTVVSIDYTSANRRDDARCRMR